MKKKTKQGGFWFLPLLTGMAGGTAITAFKRLMGKGKIHHKKKKKK